MVARMLTAEQITALRIPTADEMQTIASSIPQLELGTWQAWDVRPGIFLEVAPGFVRLYKTASHIPDAARDRAWKNDQRNIDEDLRVERAAYSSPMALVDDADLARSQRVERMKTSRPPTKRGKVTGWSRRSRRRMELQIQRVDFTPLFETLVEPVMVTLTLPDKWEDVAPTPQAFKAIINRFRSAYRYAWGREIAGVWKMEFQRRGAPHLHILMTPPEGVVTGSKSSLRGLPFFDSDARHGQPRVDWLSRAWARSVNHPDPAELAKNERYGTSVDYVGDEYRDPRTIAGYFSKHGMIFGDKEYQNQMPQLWLDAIESGEMSGNFWGVWVLKKASAVLQLNDVAPIATNSDVSGVSSDGLTYPGIIGVSAVESSSEVEERRPWATDATVCRAAQRDTDTRGTGSSDAVIVERYMRKLAKARAMREHLQRRAVLTDRQNDAYGPMIRNKHGQLILRGAWRNEHGQALIRKAERVTGLDGTKRKVYRFEVAGHRFPSRVGVRCISYTTTDPYGSVNLDTGELTPVECKRKKYRVGWYAGGSGAVLVSDGRDAGHDIRRLLASRSMFALAV